MVRTLPLAGGIALATLIGSAILVAIVLTLLSVASAHAGAHDSVSAKPALYTCSGKVFSLGSGGYAVDNATLCAFSGENALRLLAVCGIGEFCDAVTVLREGGCEGDAITCASSIHITSVHSSLGRKLFTDAAPKPDCFAFAEHQRVTLRGTIVQSATTEEEEGDPPHKYMAIILDHPVCLATNVEDKYTFIEENVPTKWLGHYVDITGNMEGGLNGYAIDEISSIKDVNAAPAEKSVDSKPSPISAEAQLAALTCNQLLKAMPNFSKNAPATASGYAMLSLAYDYIKSRPDVDTLGYTSPCRVDFLVEASCRAHQKSSVMEAINSLFSKAATGKELPETPVCGA
jgi:hypothetical protein